MCDNIVIVRTKQAPAVLQSGKGDYMLEFDYCEKFKELGKMIAYDSMINAIIDLIVKYHNEALEGKRTEREAFEIDSALCLLSSIARDKKEEALKKC